MEEISYISIMNNNFGDALNEPILTSLTDNISFVHYNRRNSLDRRISAIGSVAFLWTGNTVVWGSGVLDERNTCLSNLRDMDFRCIRGPKTRQHLIAKGYDVPAVYCDPGILTSYFYRNIVAGQKRFEVGIFPHNTENPKWHAQNCRYGKYRDVVYLNYQDQIDRTIYKMSLCKRIVSSSLHGIVVAEALGIPVSWYVLTDNNDPFKFYDYFEGTDRNDIRCNDFRGYHPSSVNLLSLPIIERGKYDIRGLLDSFPYKMKDGLKEEILDFYE